MGITPLNSSFNYQYKEIKKEKHPLFGQIYQIQQLLSKRLFTSKRLVMGESICKQKLQTLMKIQKCKISDNVIEIKQIYGGQKLNNLCSPDHFNHIIFDDVEMNLESILEERRGKAFTQKQILRLIMCVLNGIMNSQQTKYQIFPLCEKSIIVKFYEEPYKVGSLENAIFKVIPLEIIDLHNLKKEDLKLYLSPETNQELFVTSTEVLPKSYVYSLGKIVLDILTDPFRRLTEISFQDISFNEEKSSINKIQLLEKSKFTQKTTSLILSMIEERQEKRIGLITLYDECRKIMNDFKGDKQKNEILRIITTNGDHVPFKKFDKKTKKRINSVKIKQSRITCPSIKQNKVSVFSFENGAKYEGNLSQSGQFQGQGTLYYPNKSICFQGNWKNNMFSGYGSLYSPSGKQGKSKIVDEVNFINFSKNKSNCWSHYEGFFFNDKKNGVGTLYFENSQKFEGKFCNDLAHGEGKFYQKDGSVIKGMWNNNQLLFVKK